eukprot:gene4287-3060_t
MGCTNSKESTNAVVNKQPSSVPTAVEINKGHNNAVVATQEASFDLNSSNPSKDLPSTQEYYSAPAVAAPSSPTKQQKKLEEACFGAGCYWGTEKYFKYKFMEQFEHLGSIVGGKVGFMGPVDAPANPSYREVCSGTTNHVEVYHFQYSGGSAQYEALVRYFFQFHDPTTLNRQGNDKGTQYASVIYTYSDEQREIASRVKEELQGLIDCGKLKPYSSKVVETDIRDSTIFYPAHDEHQDYLTINPTGYCNHRIRFKEWPTLEF